MKNTKTKFNFSGLLLKLKEKPIELYEERQHFVLKDLELDRSGKKVFVCDTYIKGIEAGIVECNVLRLSNIISIDHHAPLAMFARKISSVNLAIGWVNEMGIASDNDTVIITHTDYDSLITGLIMRGIVPPRKIFGDMAIIADHTGEENEMVDLLQSMSSAHDLEFSLRNLELWSSGKPIEKEAFEMLEGLKDERRRAEEAAKNGSFKNVGSVYYAKLDKKIESAFLTALIPEAAIILTFSPHRKYSGFWEVKTRLGKAAPEGLRLNELGIDGFDQFWGGRWNAGSNRRGQGTKIPIEEYAGLLNEKLEKHAKINREEKI